MRSTSFLAVLIAFATPTFAEGPTPLQSATAARAEWVACIRASAGRYALTTALPQDIADTAAAECDRERDGYEAFSQLAAGSISATGSKIEALMSKEDVKIHRLAVAAVLQARFPIRKADH